MEIKQIAQRHKGSFTAFDGDKEAGFITYTMAGSDKMILDHTEVNDEWRGQNIGKKIVFYIVDFARKNNMKILPLCPFAKAVFDRTKEIQDVL